MPLVAPMPPTSNAQPASRNVGLYGPRRRRVDLKLYFGARRDHPDTHDAAHVEPSARAAVGERHDVVRAPGEAADVEVESSVRVAATEDPTDIRAGVTKGRDAEERGRTATDRIGPDVNRRHARAGRILFEGPPTQPEVRRERGASRRPINHHPVRRRRGADEQAVAGGRWWGWEDLSRALRELPVTPSNTST